MSDQTLTLDDGSAAPRVEGGPALCHVLRSDDPAHVPVWIPLHDVDEMVFTRGDRALLDEPAEGRRMRALVLDDGRVSRPHARLTTMAGQCLVDDLGSKNGTIWRGEAVHQARIADGGWFEVGRSVFLFRAHVPRVLLAAPAVLQAPGLPALSTLSPALAATFATAQRVAKSSASVLLTGETGTGKEVFARRLHALSGRSGELVAVNCGALPDELIEAELFGAKKGAYSGAHTDRVGLVRAAHKGTLFLDEIGDLPLPVQAAFLRVLQEREVVPLGDTRAVPVDFRLVCATHKSLTAAVTAGRFRPDLLARLQGVSLELPPLRTRREDIGILVQGFLKRALDSTHPGFQLSQRAARALCQAEWSGNVRALEHVVGGAVALLGDAQVIEPEHLGDLPAEPVRPTPRGVAVVEGGVDDEGVNLKDLKDEKNLARKAQLESLLTEHQGNVSAVARVLGKKRMQVYRWIDAYGFDPERFRTELPRRSSP